MREVGELADDADDAKRYRKLRRAARNGALEFIVAVEHLDHCQTDGAIDSSIDDAEIRWPHCFLDKGNGNGGVV